ncbi:MAG: antitoxin, partial [Janibacter sp.]|nr:antitoxin [Janibacter sp.]
DKARSAIDKVQEAANRRTGGKFGSLIEKAGDFVEDKLGLPEDTAAEDTTPAPEDAGAPAPKPQAPAPKQDTAPSESGQSDSTGGGVLPG